MGREPAGRGRRWPRRIGQIWGSLVLAGGLGGGTAALGEPRWQGAAPLQPPPPLPPAAPRGTTPTGSAAAQANGTPGAVAELLVDLSEQRLSAFDGAHRLLYRRLVSTGVAASPTPTGSFTVASRFASTPMTGRDYHMPSVSHVLCLGGGGLPPNVICIHPAPWQEAAGQPFGVRRSHGCVRTSSATAHWLFERTAVGTPVIIQP